MKATLYLWMMVCGAWACAAHGEVLVGDELIQPGVAFKVRVTNTLEMTPDKQQLTPENADFALVAEANWSRDINKTVPGSSPRGGFVPFLKIKVEVKNKITGKMTFVDLLPHLSMTRSMHYARNFNLPEGTGDKYEVSVSVSPPDVSELSLGSGWRGAHGSRLFGAKEFKYGEVDLSSLRNQSD